MGQQNLYIIAKKFQFQIIQIKLQIIKTETVTGLAFTSLITQLSWRFARHLYQNHQHPGIAFLWIPVLQATMI